MGEEDSMQSQKYEGSCFPQHRVRRAATDAAEALAPQRPRRGEKKTSLPSDFEGEIG